MAFYNKHSDFSNFVISFTKNPYQDFQVFAKGYAQAASTLAEHLLAKPRFSDYEAYPVVFLYRQAFELHLKGFYFQAKLISHFRDVEKIEMQNNELNKHQLLPFAKFFQNICRILFPKDKNLLELSNKVIQFADEFEQIDRGSYSYRYPITTKGKASTDPHQVVNLLSLHQSMQELLGDLEVVNLGLDIEEYKCQEIFEIIQGVKLFLSSKSSEID